MTIVRIDNTQWVSGLETVRRSYCLIGPVKKKKGHKFKILDEGENIDFNFINTTLPPKELLFPQSEIILKYSIKTFDNNNPKVKVPQKEYPSKAIMGIRPCDAKANTILQMNFNTSDVKDPYWIKSYETSTFVGLACNNPCNSCFCTTTKSGPYATDGLDVILFSKENDSYFAKIITEKGKQFVDLAGWNSLPKLGSQVFDDCKNLAESKIYSKIETNKLKETELLKLHEASFWNDVAFPCINCGTCTFLCPTCWCFDIQDEIVGKSGVRAKNWDSCMFPIFTVHTTGHNPRKTKKQRLRQRFMHKLKYFVDKYDKGIMCVGCGRCVRNCPVNIDIRKICDLMNNFKPDNNACSVNSK